MCCFFSSLVFFGPRLAFLVYWLMRPIKVNLAYAAFNFPVIVSLLSLIFLPWTALMFIIFFPLGGLDWIWLGLGMALDIFSYVGGYHNRNQVPGYTGP